MIGGDMESDSHQHFKHMPIYAFPEHMATQVAVFLTLPLLFFRPPHLVGHILYLNPSQQSLSSGSAILLFLNSLIPNV